MPRAEGFAPQQLTFDLPGLSPMQRQRERFERSKKLLGYAGRGAFVALTAISSINAFAHTTNESGTAQYKSDVNIALPAVGLDFSHIIPLPTFDMNTDGLAGYGQIDSGGGGRVRFYELFDAPIEANSDIVIPEIDDEQLSTIARDPLDTLPRLYAPPTKEDVIQNAEDMKKAVELAGAIGAISGIVILLGIDALRKKSVREQVTRNILAPAMLVGLLGLTLAHQVQSTLDTKLDNPQYSGLIALYPDIQRRIENAVSNLDEAPEQIAASMNAMLDLLASLKGFNYLSGDTTTNVLYIANSECLPGVFETLQSLIDNGVHVDAVIIGGNMSLSNRDNAIEDFCVNGIEGFEDIPVFYTRGAADGPATRQRLQEMENVYPLNGYVREVDGLRLIGSDYPRIPASMSPEDRLSQDARKLFAEIIYGNNGHPFDIVAVDDIRSASEIIGRVPLILTSSDEAEVEMIDGTSTLGVQSGSVGGGGLPALLDGGTSTQVAQILSFKRLDEERQRLVAITRMDFGVEDKQLSLDVSTCPIPREDFVSC